MISIKKVFSNITAYQALLLLLVAVVLFRLFYIPFNGYFPHFDGDVYAHLSRFKQFWHSGVFREEIFPFANAPYGEAWHYTRLFDLVALIFVYPASLFFEFESVFPAVSNTIPMLFHLFSALLLWYGLKPYKRSWLMAGLCLLYAPTFSAHFHFGAFDHHFLEIFFAFGTVAFALRYFNKPDRKQLFFMTLCLACAFWVSIEGLFFYFFVMGAFFILYLLKKEKIQTLIFIQAVYTSLILLFLLINPPYEGFFFFELGRLSIFYVAFHLWILSSLLLLSKVPQKLSYQITIPACISILFLLLFKDGLFMPLMSKTLYDYWYWALEDVKPIFNSVFAVYVFFYVSVIVLCFIRFQKKRPISLFLLFGSCFYFLMMIFHVRFNVFLSVICSFSLPLCFSIKTKKRDYAFILLIAFILPTVYLIFRYSNPFKPRSRLIARPVYEFLQQGSDAGVLLADADSAMYLHYKTERPIVAWNFYRDPRGLETYYRIFRSPPRARYIVAQLKERNVKTIVLSKYVNRDVFKKGMFLHLIQVDRNIPKFLKPVPLPPDVAAFWDVYDVVYD